jgi:hypothetical protein
MRNTDQTNPRTGFAQEVNFSGERTPRLDQAGWLRAQEISRSFLSARRRGGRLDSRTNSLSNLVDRPARSHQRGFAAFSLVACKLSFCAKSRPGVSHNALHPWLNSWHRSAVPKEMYRQSYE